MLTCGSGLCWVVSEYYIVILLQYFQLMFLHTCEGSISLLMLVKVVHPRAVRRTHGWKRGRALGVQYTSESVGFPVYEPWQVPAVRLSGSSQE